MKNFVAKGKVITVVAAEPITAGDLIKVGGLIGVAAGSAETGEATEVAITGVFEAPKAAEAVSQGDKLYYVSAGGNLSKTETGNTFVGFAYEDAGAGAETVKLLLANGA